VRSDGEPLLAELFRHLIPQDMRFRFPGGMQEVRHERPVAMLQGDDLRTENFLAFVVDGKSLVASTMLAGDDTSRQAEVAIAVHSEYKQKGVEWEMLRYAAQEAKRKVSRLSNPSRAESITTQSG
jgi:ribosomal protein S18 acetylase RimI-like enzyme